MNAPVRDIYRNRRWWATLVAVSILTLTTMMYVVEGEVEEGAYIEVEDVFFIMRDQDNETTSMDIDVFITNNGEEDLSDVTVRAFAVDMDTNLAGDEAVAMLGSLGGERTIEGNLSITIPNGEAYRVELLVFKEGKLAIRGAGEVNLRKSTVVEESDGWTYRFYIPTTTNYTTNDGDVPPSTGASDDEKALSADSEDVASYVMVIGVGAAILLMVLIVKGLVGHIESGPPRERIVPKRVRDDWKETPYWYPPRTEGPIPPSEGIPKEPPKPQDAEDAEEQDRSDRDDAPVPK